MINLFQNISINEEKMLGIFVFVIEFIIYTIDCIITKKNTKVTIRPRKISAHLGIFLPLFSTWICYMAEDGCKNQVDKNMLVGLGIIMIIFGVFLLLLRINRFYTYILDNDVLIIYKFFILKKELRISEITKVEQKSDGIKLYLRDNKTIFIDFMFENQDLLKKELRVNRIYMC